ncbi:DUF294 nucleotidyltransferase-like domain-containing protein [Corynebacterium sp.]|uniref:DUF294 nucleotidyltransferase-like domain-containing protein n=1 Tax=Corynebacterium sp. TaxID=1720 RepID=UPI0026DA8884|nr:DUF294 nucleotidyltransferase-like domain-containing protein [Corynebacterium sp.]MDO5076661.1 DUF294 nucleotidyltransferase-like domain-containing protein [Corynebacterium sp.]
MSVELDEVRDFLAASAPYAQLPSDVLDRLPAQMTMKYIRRGETIIAAGDTNDYTYIIRSGAVDVLDSEGVLLDRRDAGRSFGYSTLIGDETCHYTMVAVEDTLALLLPREAFVPLAQEHPELARFFSGQSARMSAAASSLRQQSSSDVLRTRLKEFMITTPATVSPAATIQQAAQFMKDNNVSSLLITGPNDSVEGIVTDRDMRGRVVAGAMDVTLPVTEIMTAQPRVVESETLAFEAMLIMAEMGIHHLPVVDSDKLVGIVASADIMRLLRHDPIYLTADLARRTTTEELKQVYDSAHDVAVRFIERGASPEEVTNLLTVAADALARRLITLAEAELGPPPVPYAFVVLGSQGRRGMGLASDQDNALVLSDAYVEAEHGSYFAELSKRVCTGLDAAGQVLCPGDMMASNPEWRMTVSQWNNAFHTWITAPEPEALLHAQVFFDMRGIYGDKQLADQVVRNAVQTARNAGRLHAHLATLAARREPPLGFFRGLVVDRSGEYANTLDVKKGGTAAIVQMARLFALASGVHAVGTRERLSQAAGHGAVSARGAEDLRDAFDFLNTIALQQQANQVRKGERPNYHIDPKELGKLDREHLRDAFQIIKSMQSALATKYPVRNI